jgi:hypothetical protein
VIFKTSHGKHTIIKNLLFENNYRPESKKYLKLITKIFLDSRQDARKVKNEQDFSPKCGRRLKN